MIDLHSQNEIRTNSEKNDFCGIVWPAAILATEDIQNNLLTIDGCTLTRTSVYSLSGEDYLLWILLLAYRHEWIPYEYILNKHRMIKKHLVGNIFNLCFMSFSLEHCLLYIDPRDDYSHVRNIDLIKQNIRARIAPQIRDYEYDTVIHVSDNYLQTCANMIIWKIIDFLDTYQLVPSFHGMVMEVIVDDTDKTNILRNVCKSPGVQFRVSGLSQEVFLFDDLIMRCCYGHATDYTLGDA